MMKLKEITAVMLMIGILCPQLAVGSRPVNPGSKPGVEPMPELQGPEATQYLEQSGLLESLKNAVNESLAPGDFAEVRKRTASDLFTNDQFGRSVAISGNTAVIGAPNDDISPRTDQGSAYVFERNVGGAEGWSEVKKLVGPTPDAFEEFGYSVAIERDTIVVGKRFEFVSGVPRNGTAHIFGRNAGGAGNWGLVKTVSVAGATTVDGFGQAVALSGDTLAVGAPGERVGGVANRGAVYTFYRNSGGIANWGQVGRMTAADGAEADSLGASVAISGTTVVTGANRNSNGEFTYEGAAYVFERDEGGYNEWGEVAKLEASDESPRSYFGWSVAIDGNTAVVGNYAVDAGFESNGSAYVFERNAGGVGNWGQVKKLMAGDGSQNDFFGQAVAVRGDVIVIGAMGDDFGTATQQGSAYVFERNAGGTANWGERQKITGSDSMVNDSFGNAVAVDGKVILVGATLDDFDGPVYHQNAGSGFFFVRETVSWVGNAKSVTANCTVDDGFGEAVAISGDLMIVGAPRTDVADNANHGAAYIFRHDGAVWALEKRITSGQSSAGNLFGVSVTISGDHAAVGSPHVNGQTGAVHVFARNQGGAGNWGEVATITASDGTFNSLFGDAVSLDGGTLAVGAPGATIAGNFAQGAAYVFERDFGGPGNWGEVRKLIGSDGGAFEKFGSTIDISVDSIIVGAPLQSLTYQNQGAAYVFERNSGGAANWGQVRKITVAGSNIQQQFGFSVAIDGGHAVVGAINEKVGNKIQRGAAYVFGRDTGGAGNWGQVRRLLGSDGAAYNYFGGSVAIDGDSIVVGAQCASGGGVCRGSAYVFDRDAGGADNWGESQRLLASDGSNYDRLGLAVAIGSGVIVTGVPLDTVGGAAGIGSAAIFNRSGSSWIEAGKISPPVPADCGVDDEYGFSVAIDGDTAVLGAPSDDIGVSQNQGSAYVLERNAGGPNAWGLVRVLVAADGSSGDNFGVSVKISGDTIAVGADLDDVDGNQDQGSVYVFERNVDGADRWGQVKRLSIDGGSQNQRIGKFVALDQDTIAIGFVGENTNTGSVHVFDRNAGGSSNWGQIQTLRPSAPQIGQQFGIAIAISGDSIAVGSNLKLINSFQTGAAYIFNRATGGFIESTVIAPSDPIGLAAFGYSLDIDGDRLVVGSPQAAGTGDSRSGAAYLFERNAGGAENWGQVKRLAGSDIADGDRFADSVAIDGDLLIVGSPKSDVGANPDQGAAYVFRQNNGGADDWGEERKLYASDGSAGDEFGSSVDTSSGNFLIGAFLARLFSSVRDPKSFGAPARNGAGYFFGEASLAPTAARADVRGRIRTVEGIGIANATITMTDESGRSIVARSNGFGRFVFESVEVGRTYVVSAEGKNVSVAPVTLKVSDSVWDLELVSEVGLQ